MKKLKKREGYHAGHRMGVLMQQILVLLLLNCYGKVAGDFCIDQGATREHSHSYATEEQRRYVQKDQELVYKNLMVVAL